LRRYDKTNHSDVVRAFGMGTSLTLASTSVTGARRCGSDIRHLAGGHGGSLMPHHTC
jgi:hypothetical protein